MLSKRTYFFLDHYIPFCSYIGCIPFGWNPQTRLYTRSPRSHQLLRRHAIVIFFFSIVFLTFQSIRFRVSQDYDNFNIVYFCAIVAYAMYQIIFVLIYFEDQFYCFLNSQLSYFRHINQNYLPAHDPNRDKYTIFVEFCIVAMACGISLMVVVPVLLLLISPHFPISLGYYLPRSWPYFITAPLVLLKTGYTFTLFALNLFNVFAEVFYYGAIITPFVTKEFRMGRTGYKSVAVLRHPETLSMAYRSVQILHKQIVSIIGGLIVPTQAIIAELVVISSYMIIRHGHQMNRYSKLMLITWSCGGVIVWWATLYIGGCIHFYGMKVLESWKYHEWDNSFDKKFMKKFTRSCKPLMVNFGSTYVIKRQSALKFLRGLSKGILRILLAL